MAWRFGLVLTLLAACAEGGSQRDLVSALTVEPVANIVSSGVRLVSMAGLDAQTFVVARAMEQGADFCSQCVDPNALGCAAICQRTLIDVTRYSAGVAADPVVVHEVFPLLQSYSVDALDVVALDETHVGVGWLECDHAICGESTERGSCTARYAVVELPDEQPAALRVGRDAPAVATLYNDLYGDLQLAFNPGTRQLLAVLGKQKASGVGVRAAIFDESGAKKLWEWQAYGGAAASAPVPVAEDGGFLIAADDPAPSVPAAAVPCANACDCAPPSVAEQSAGGLYALRPGLDEPPERIAARRTVSADGQPPAIAAVAAAGRVHVIVASTQPGDGDAVVFEPADTGWKPRYAAPAPAPTSTPTPAPRWLGALADETHLAWIGFDGSDDPAEQRRLVAGVVADQLAQRGEIAEVAPGRMIRVAPVSDGDGVKSTYLLRGVQAVVGGASVPRYEVLAVHAQW